MGAHPETAILRRFGALNALNLLYLQGELTNLENALHHEEKANLESGHVDRVLYSRDWESLRNSVTGEDGNPGQWNTMLEIRKKLVEYSRFTGVLIRRFNSILTVSRIDQALLVQHKIAKIGPPNKRDLRFLLDWMDSPFMGAVYLVGDDSEVWNLKVSGYKLDELVCLLPRQRDESFAWLGDYLIEQYHYLLGHFFKRPDSADAHANTVQYSDRRIETFLAAIGSILGSLLLVSSIAALYSIGSTGMRLLTIGFFTTGFALCLCLFTNGRMVEVFSAAAA